MQQPNLVIIFSLVLTFVGCSKGNNSSSGGLSSVQSKSTSSAVNCQGCTVTAYGGGQVGFAGWTLSKSLQVKVLDANGPAQNFAVTWSCGSSFCKFGNGSNISTQTGVNGSASSGTITILSMDTTATNCNASTTNVIYADIPGVTSTSAPSIADKTVTAFPICLPSLAQVETMMVVEQGDGAGKAGLTCAAWESQSTISALIATSANVPLMKQPTLYYGQTTSLSATPYTPSTPKACYSGVPILFSLQGDDSPPTELAYSSATDSTGSATVTFLVPSYSSSPPSPINYLVTVSSPDAPSTSATLSVTAVSSGSPSLTMSAGSTQIELVAGSGNPQLAVRVKDTKDIAQHHVPVIWSGQGLSGKTIYTDGSGYSILPADSWVLNMVSTSQKPYAILASIPWQSQPVTFSIAVVPGAPSAVSSTLLAVSSYTTVNAMAAIKDQLGNSIDITGAAACWYVGSNSSPCPLNCTDSTTYPASTNTDLTTSTYSYGLTPSPLYSSSGTLQAGTFYAAISFTPAGGEPLCKVAPITTLEASAAAGGSGVGVSAAPASIKIVPTVTTGPGCSNSSCLSTTACTSSAPCYPSPLAGINGVFPDYAFQILNSAGAPLPTGSISWTSDANLNFQTQTISVDSANSNLAVLHGISANTAGSFTTTGAVVDSSSALVQYTLSLNNPFPVFDSFHSVLFATSPPPTSASAPMSLSLGLNPLATSGNSMSKYIVAFFGCKAGPSTCPVGTTSIPVSSATFLCSAISAAATPTASCNYVPASGVLNANDVWNVTAVVSGPGTPNAEIIAPTSQTAVGQTGVQQVTVSGPSTVASAAGVSSAVTSSSASSLFVNAWDGTTLELVANLVTTSGGPVTSGSVTFYLANASGASGPSLSDTTSGVATQFNSNPVSVSPPGVATFSGGLPGHFFLELCPSANIWAYAVVSDGTTFFKSIPADVAASCLVTPPSISVLKDPFQGLNNLGSANLANIWINGDIEVSIFVPPANKPIADGVVVTWTFGWSSPSNPSSFPQVVTSLTSGGSASLGSANFVPFPTGVPGTTVTLSVTCNGSHPLVLSFQL